ncbi:MAG TPA: trypsin-like serine protease [Polyangia bacterium]
MKRASSLLLMLSIALAACSAPPPGAATRAIINGTLDDGDANVVLVFAQVPGQSSGSLCTGEVISPHVVLTAAHCMAPSTVGAGAQFTVFTGTMLPAMGSPPKEQLLDVTESHYVPTFGYNPMTGGDQDDVGVLILAQPTTIAPLPFNHFNLTASANGADVRIVGYGLTVGTDTQGTTAGTKHQAPTKLFDYQPTTLTLYDAMHSNCEGDSGGPALVMLDGKERIAGITQVGYVKCPVEMASTDTRVDAYASFIDGYVNRLDPPAVAAGGACTTDADCSPLPCLAGICTAPCDPAASPTTCPSGTECTSVNDENMCAKPSHKGCSITGWSPSSGGALFPLALLFVVALRRRDHAAG